MSLAHGSIICIFNFQAVKRVLTVMTRKHCTNILLVLLDDCWDFAMYILYLL